MKKVLFILAAFIFVSTTSFAQKGKVEIGIAADVGIPTGDFGDGYKTGYGGLLKGLFGVCNDGKVTLTTGYSIFKEKGSSAYDSKYSIIPFLAGYRHNFSGFYVEPQLGVSILGSKYTISNVDYSNHTGAFTWAAGVGYAMKGFDGGIRYQGASKNGGHSNLVGFMLDTI